MYIFNKLVTVRGQRKTLALASFIFLVLVLPLQYSTIETQKVFAADGAIGQGGCGTIYTCKEGNVWANDTCQEPTKREEFGPCDCGCERTGTLSAECKSCTVPPQCSSSDGCGPGSGNTCGNTSADCVNCSCVLDPSPRCGYREINTCIDTYLRTTPAPGDNSTEFYWYCNGSSQDYFRCSMKKDAYLRSFVTHADGSLEEFDGSEHVGIERWGAVSGYGKIDYAGRNGNGVKDVFTTPLKITSFGYTGGSISHFVPDGGVCNGQSCTLSTATASFKGSQVNFIGYEDCRSTRSFVFYVL